MVHGKVIGLIVVLAGDAIRARSRSNCGFNWITHAPKTEPSSCIARKALQNSQLMKITEFDLKGRHMARKELILRQIKAICLTTISKALLTPRRLEKGSEIQK